MALERNSRREILKKLLTLGPLAALAGAFGVNGAKKAEAYTYNESVVINSPYGLALGTSSPSLGTIDERASVDGAWSALALTNLYGAAGSADETVDIRYGFKDPNGFVREGGSIRVGKEGDYSSGNQKSYIAFRPAAANEIPTERMRITSTGNVGIGTTQIYTLLHCATPSSGHADVLAIENADSTTSTAQGVRIRAFLRGGGSGSSREAGLIIFGKEGTYATGSEMKSYIAFAPSAPNEAVTERMRITSAGNVGIGTPTPAYLLDVAGSAHIAGDLSVSGVVQGTASQAYYGA